MNKYGGVFFNFCAFLFPLVAFKLESGCARAKCTIETCAKQRS